MNGAQHSASFAATTLRISAGAIVWALHFGAIYGFTALACARGWHGAVSPFIGVATALALAAALAVIAAGYRRREEFEYWLAGAIGAFALVAIAYQALPAFVLPVCK